MTNKLNEETASSDDIRFQRYRCGIRKRKYRESESKNG